MARLSQLQQCKQYTTILRPTAVTHSTHRCDSITYAHSHTAGSECVDGGGRLSGGFERRGECGCDGGEEKVYEVEARVGGGGAEVELGEVEG